MNPLSVDLNGFNQSVLRATWQYALQRTGSITSPQTKTNVYLQRRYFDTPWKKNQGPNAQSCGGVGKLEAWGGGGRGGARCRAQCPSCQTKNLIFPTSSSSHLRTDFVFYRLRSRPPCRIWRRPSAWEPRRRWTAAVLARQAQHYWVVYEYLGGRKEFYIG